MENMRNLTTENDMQELWEMSGRVKATIEWAKRESYIEKETLIAMLGGLPEIGREEKGGGNNESGIGEI